LQSVVVVGHVAVQALPLQTWVGEHAVVHPPQWAGSIVRSTQIPLQSVVPPGHPQVPLLHCMPPVHLFPHDPQLSMLFVSFTQVPPHIVC
jgi:hypothetical protein